MSIKNAIQLAELQRKSLHAEKSADAIQKKIIEKCIVEANRLFQESASDIKKDDREKLSKQLSFLVEQAEKYFREAVTFEAEGKQEHAREKYKKVAEIAIDYPKLPEALKRIDDAIALVRTLEHHAKRRGSRQDKQSALPTTSSQSGRFRGWLPLLACFFLLLIMVWAGLFYTDNLNLPFTKKDTMLQVAPLEKDGHSTTKDTVNLLTNKNIKQAESQTKEKDKTTALKQQTPKKALSKEAPGIKPDSRKQAGQIATSEINEVLPPAPKKQIFESISAPIEEDRQQKPSQYETGSTQQESLSPVPVSFLQMKKNIGDTSSADDGFSIRQDIQPTADIARKSEETMGEKRTPQLQDPVINRLPADDSEQPQQTPPVINQEDELPVEISSSLENSAESVYTIQRGDTLGLISLKVYGASSKWSAIANANKNQLSDNPDGLQVGMTLVIPTLSETANVPLSPGSSTSLPDLNEDGTYTVQSGDSLGTIAQKLFGKSWKWKMIYELNSDVLTAAHTLKVGQILKVKASGLVKKTIESSEPEP